MALKIINRRLSVQEFADYLKSYAFPTPTPHKLVLHHTWRPTTETWQGETSILALKRYYEHKGWPAGPHIFVAEDGIWLFSPMNRDGIHAGTLNTQSIGLEVVGNYDHTIWLGQTKFNALAAISLLMKRLNLTSKQLHFHREVSTQSCPGYAISKTWLLRELERFESKYLKVKSNMKSVEARSEVMVPLDAVEAVAFVRKYELFTIQTQKDVEEATRFYRFYQLIQQKNDTL